MVFPNFGFRRWFRTVQYVLRIYINSIRTVPRARGQESHSEGVHRIGCLRNSYTTGIISPVLNSHLRSLRNDDEKQF